MGFTSDLVSFNNRVESALSFFEACDLLEERLYFPDYSAIDLNQVRLMSYLDVWRHFRDSRMYDARLRDGSLVQFRYEPSALTVDSYYWLESPIQCDDYREFLRRTYRVSYEDEGYAHWDLYEEYLTQCDPKPHVTPVRYDYAPSTYRPCVHPAAHVHFGVESELRVAARRRMNPIGFAILVARLAYPSAYEGRVVKRGMADARSRDRWLAHVRSAAPLVGAAHWSDADEEQLYVY